MTKKPTKKETPQDVIERWTERDLTASAANHALLPAFEVEDQIQEITELLAAGRRPILIGESGVGKTAIVHEMARRVAEGMPGTVLDGKRVLQFSLAQFASGLSSADELAPEFQKLVEALFKVGDSIVPFFRDIHAAYRFDLEPQFLNLGSRFPGMIIAEGVENLVQAMIEHEQSLTQYFVVVPIHEPTLDRLERITQAWSEEQATSHSLEFTPEALDQALHLSHRFLTRSRQPRNVLDLLGQVAGLARPDRPVESSDVIGRFCATHKTPRALIDPAETLDLGELENDFGTRILGQPEAVRAIVNMIGLIKAGLSDVRRPFGVFLFAGPTGVGKTHVAHLLAEFLFGSRERLIRINMGDYDDPDAPDTLFGNPHANNLPIRRGMLAQRIQGHPFCVLLLDEFEKAHRCVHDRFLQLFDEGTFINGASELISCRSTIMVATSNAGAEVFRGQVFGFGSQGDKEAQSRELDRCLEQHFRFEFLNRFDQIVHFHPLNRESIRTIALRELELLKERSGMKQRNLELQIDESVLDWLAVHGYDPDYGARFLRRTIERNVTATIADTIVRFNPPPGTRIELGVRSHQIFARTRSDAEQNTPVKEPVSLPHGTSKQVHVLDSESLSAEANRILDRARPRLSQLQERIEERSEMLARMNEPEFWSDSTDRTEVLERFRDLDVSIHSEERLAAVIGRLEQAGQSSDASHLARWVELAAEALSEWEYRLSDEGASAVWVVVSNVDPIHAAGRWIEDVVQMEMAWCRRLGLRAEVLSFGTTEGHLSRVALGVEGPGAQNYLEMEEGMHRLFRHPGPDLRARVEVIPQSSPHPESWKDIVPSRRKIEVLTKLHLETRFRGRMDLSLRGIVVEMYGDDDKTLSHLLRDLHDTWANPPLENLDPARHYGEDGRGAVDHRTSIAVVRMKDVLKGRLDPFLEGWRRR